MLKKFALKVVPCYLCSAFKKGTFMDQLTANEYGSRMVLGLSGLFGLSVVAALNGRYPRNGRKLERQLEDYTKDNVIKLFEQLLREGPQPQQLGSVLS